MKVLMIGAGDIAKSHGRAVVKLGGKVIGAFDVNKEGLRKYCMEFECDALEYDQLDEYIEKADYVVLCTPPTKRIDYAEKILKAHKPMYMEKPIATTMADAQILVDMAQKYDGKILVGFAHRYRPAFQKMVELVQSGILGEPVQAFSHRYGPGFGFGQRSLAESWRTDPNLACGMTIESISHEFNLLSALVGEFDTIAANVVGTIPSVPKYDTNTNMTMHARNGAIVTIGASWSSAVGVNVKGFIGTKGAVFLKGRNMFEFDEVVYKTIDMPTEQSFIFNDSYAKDQDGVIFNAHEHFFDCLLNGKEICTPLSEGVKVLLLSNAALESSREKKTVTLNYEVKNANICE